jgi:hypothetical protein
VQVGQRVGDLTRVDLHVRYDRTHTEVVPLLVDQ